MKNTVAYMHVKLKIAKTSMFSFHRAFLAEDDTMIKKVSRFIKYGNFLFSLKIHRVYGLNWDALKLPQVRLRAFINLWISLLLR